MPNVTTYTTADRLAEAAEHLASASALLEAASPDINQPRVAETVIRAARFCAGLATFLAAHTKRLRRLSQYA